MSKNILKIYFGDKQIPGTIVNDFQMLLDYIGTEGISVSEKNRFITLKELHKINEQLSHPITIRKKRPSQKSYPHINGLYLLLRASGLSLIKGKGTKKRLLVNEKVLKSWQDLNAAERYFTLLETWLLRGNPEIVSESSRKEMPLYSWKMLFDNIPEKGLQVPGNRNAVSLVEYFPGPYNIALSELFGIISVLHGKPQEGEGWHIDRIERTPFGDDLLKIFTKAFNDYNDYRVAYREAFEQPFGQLQSILKPSFPQWKKNLIIEGHEFKDGIYVFKVFLPKLWRRIAIAATNNLDSLSSAILTSIDFDFEHLYKFSYENYNGLAKEIYHPYMEEEPFLATEYRIGDLPLEPGETMTYLYDFGDMWEFGVDLEEIKPPDPSIKEPRIIEEHGKAPVQYYMGEYDEEEYEDDVEEY